MTSADLATEAHHRAVDEAMLRHEAACQAALERDLRRFTRAAIANFERRQHTVTASLVGDGFTDQREALRVAFASQPDPDPIRIPPGDDLLDTVAAQAILEATTKIYRDRAATTAADGMAVELGISFDLQNRLLDGVIASQSGMHITTAPQDLVDEMMRSLQASYDTGASIPTASREMRKTGYTHAKGAAERIARTELLGGVNASSLALVQGATDLPYKTWMATMDGRTRPSHVAASGQSVPVAGMFSVGGASLAYPGDSNGPADEVVNCRCTLGYADSPNLATIAGGQEMAAVAEDQTDETAIGASWSGVIAQEGVDTGDGRRIEQGALEWRTLPLTLMSQKTTPEWGGHADAQIAGRIDTIGRAGQDITGAGVFDAGEWGADTERLVREGMLKGISVDLAVDEVEVIPDPDVEDEIEAWFLGTLNILKGTILGATIVPFPAFENASIAIVAGAAMSLRNPRREVIDGESKVVLSFFMPFGADTLTASAADESVEDAIAAVEDSLDALRARIASRA